MRKILTGVAAAAVFAFSASAQVLAFDGIAAGADQTPIGNFYNDGSVPNFGITFFGNALALGSMAGDCGGSGSFAQQPSGCGVLVFLTGGSTGMNRAAGFTTGFSLFYSAIDNPGSLQVWSGLNGTGSVLGTRLLPVTPRGSAAACGGQAFCPFVAAGVGFAGTALSVTFAGVADQIALDDVTSGSVTPGAVVPEPSTYSPMATGLVGLAGVARRRRAQR